jgi:hypothetical protein
MNLTSLRELAIKTPRQDGFVGHWRIIEWQPNLFVPQRFAVGVCVESTSQGRDFRLMEKPGRLECFFHPQPIRRDFSSLMAMLRAWLAEPETDSPPSPHLILGEPCFIRGESAQTLVERLFADNIMAAKPRNERETSDEIGPDTDSARASLSSFLKQLTGLQYDRIVRENGQTLSDHYLDVTLAPDHGAGSVISVCYKSAQTIEMKMLRAANDINAYATSQNRQKKALFLLEPDESAALTARDRATIDRLIGNECWKLEQAGFATPRNTRIRAMAQDIKDWATPLLTS